MRRPWVLIPDSLSLVRKGKENLAGLAVVKGSTYER